MNIKTKANHRHALRIILIFIILLGITDVSCRRHTEDDPQPDDEELQIFPADNSWNQDISSLAVHPNSDDFIASMGNDTGIHPDFGTVWADAPIGIPYVIVSGGQPLVNITYTEYGDQSDPGPFPISDDAPVEGGVNSDGDRHVLVVDRTNKMLYELYRAFKVADGWQAGSGAKWDLRSNAVRPKYWTSADAAGLPIFPGLVRWDEVEKGQINHALRFTAGRTQRGFIYPARHFASASNDPDFPPMGLRVRLKSSVDISHFSAKNQVILTALKRYGMFVADNGSDWYISGSPDSRWNDEELSQLSQIKGHDFEAVLTGAIEK